MVNSRMLHRHMSEPRWTPAQEDEAERLCAAVERELSAALYGAQITPVPRNEVVGVTREGMVDTSMPIASITSLNGVSITSTDDGPVLPTGWALRDHRLWVPATGDPYALGVPSYLRRPVAVGPYSGSAPFYTGLTVALQYLGGWGAEPTLVEAILRKAKIRMRGAHSDTVVISGLNAQAPNASTQESPYFTDDDMRALGRYRNLGWGGGG